MKNFNDRQPLRLKPSEKRTELQRKHIIHVETENGFEDIDLSDEPIMSEILDKPQYDAFNYADENYWIPYSIISNPKFQDEVKTEIEYYFSKESTLVFSHIPRISTLKNIFFNQVYSLDADDSIDFLIDFLDQHTPIFKKKFFVRLLDEVIEHRMFIDHRSQSEYFGFPAWYVVRKAQALEHFLVKRFPDTGPELPVSGVPKFLGNITEFTEVVGPGIVGKKFQGTDDYVFDLLAKAYRISCSSEKLRFQPYFRKLFLVSPEKMLRILRSFMEKGEEIRKAK